MYENGRSRRRTLIWVAGIAGVALVGGTIGLLSRTVGTPVAAPLINHVVDAAQSPPAPRLVRWFIDSEPAGAQVVDEQTQGVLCITPCAITREYREAKVPVVLRKADYQRLSLTLDQSQDEKRRADLKVIGVDSVEILPILKRKK